MGGRLIFVSHTKLAAQRDHFVRHLTVRSSVRPSVCLSGSHTFLVVMRSYVSQATHVFLGMLPVCFKISTVEGFVTLLPNFGRFP